MNRNISFRIWDEGMSGSWWLDSPSLQYHAELNHPIMQFTGLVDKNGQVIYEGDIVNWDIPGFDEANEISFFEGCFGHVIYSGKPYQEFVPINKARAGAMIVVGNIYQNPELLQNN